LAERNASAELLVFAFMAVLGKAKACLNIAGKTPATCNAEQNQGHENYEKFKQCE
jgi:hypothetical protein